MRVQKRLEDIAYKLRIPQRKPWDAMSKDVSKATALITQRDKVKRHMFVLPTSQLPVRCHVCSAMRINLHQLGVGNDAHACILCVWPGEAL